MSTDLQAALREAVADAPFAEPDLRTVVAAGSRRVRRRAAFWGGALALALVAVLTSVALGRDRSEQQPQPADLVQLDLGAAHRQDLDVLASVRTTWRDPVNDLDYDRLEGLTADGRVLRSRYTADGDVYELGLLNPETRNTDWLPPPPVAAQNVVELTADQPVLFAGVSPRRGVLLVFDRQSETWTKTTLRLPAGLEAHLPPRLALAPEGRLYLGNNFEGESAPVYWWSYAVPGGDRLPEPGLAGGSVAYADGVRASVDSGGRVVLSSSAGARLVTDERPAGCEPQADSALPWMPNTVGLAGDRPVVTYRCRDAAQAMTVVYERDGEGAVQVAGAGFLAADAHHVLLSRAQDGPGALYLLDLDRLSLARVAPAPHEGQVGLADGLVLWNRFGPIDDKDVYDAVWEVTRLPADE